jgi:hypothetical protein
VSDWTNKVTGAMLIVFGLKLGVSEIN